MNDRSGIRSRGAGLVLAGIAVVMAAWLVLNSRFFSVDRVMVRGVRQVGAEEVRDLAAVPPGSNLIRLSLSEVAGRVEGHPWVARALVLRDLPSTLLIQVRERRAAGWLDAGAGAVVVAGDGTVLERMPRPPRKLPQVGPAEATVLPGERVWPAPPALRTTAGMPEGLLSRVATVEAGSTGLSLELRGGGQVRYGESTELPEKHRALVSILRWADERGIALGVVDLTVPAAPTLRPAGGTRIRVPPDAS